MRLLRAPNPSDSVGRVVLRALVAVFLSAGGLAGPLTPVRAVNTLSDPAVSPNRGTTADTFTFSVRYVSQSPARAPTSIWASVAGLTVGLAFDGDLGGSATQGTYVGTSSEVPAGSWPVTFHADVPGPNDAPTPVAITGELVVTQVTGPTPPPPTPTPPPTPVPTPTPTLPPGATPRPPTPRPTPTPTLRPGETPRPTPTRAPGQTQAPTVGASAAASADSSSANPTSTDPAATDRGSPAPGDGVASGSAGATGSPQPEPASGEPDADERGFVSTPWLVLGGGLSAVGAGVIVVNWVANRRRVGPAP